VASATPEGMYLLKEMPTGDILPEDFVIGSRIHLEKVVKKMSQLYSRIAPAVVTQWNAFLTRAPVSDDAMEYVREHPLHIPFFDTVFSSSAPASITEVPEPLQLHSLSRVSVPLDSVNWSRRGVKRKRRDPAAKNSSQIIKGPPGILLYNEIF
jgi:hypothetical protein